MPLSSIVMSYKENCKAEGEIMTKFKIARMHFAEGKKQSEISECLKCHKNTVNNIIKICRGQGEKSEIWSYLKEKERHIRKEKLILLFGFLKNQTRKPKGNRLSIQPGSFEENYLLEKFKDTNYGFKRMFKQLKREGSDCQNVYTIGKVKGVYKRNDLKTKKIRTSNGERRALYIYDQIAAFQYLQYDTKEIADAHALPPHIYNKFKNSKKGLPKYQWTIVDAKTKTRFLAWSYSLSSYFGFKFLEYVINWLRAHGIQGKINVQMDMGGEFYSGSKRKQKQWNDYFGKYNVYVYDTEGVKWKQNLVERTHKTDDEDFYCPRGDKINSKTEFLLEGQFWIIYYNSCRPNSGEGMNDMAPKEKLESLGIYNAGRICNFPCMILEDFFDLFQKILNHENDQNFLGQKSQNVLTQYLKGPYIF